MVEVAPHTFSPEPQGRHLCSTQSEPPFPSSRPLLRLDLSLPTVCQSVSPPPLPPLPRPFPLPRERAGGGGGWGCRAQLFLKRVTQHNCKQGKHNKHSKDRTTAGTVGPGPGGNLGVVHGRTMVRAEDVCENAKHKQHTHNNKLKTAGTMLPGTSRSRSPRHGCWSGHGRPQGSCRGMAL